jgi:hypothetical protein
MGSLPKVSVTVLMSCQAIDARIVPQYICCTVAQHKYKNRQAD